MDTSNTAKMNQFNFTARNCEIGERYTNEFTCIQCEPGTYTFSPQIKPDTECPPCPIQGRCKDQTLFSREGFVRFNPKSEVFVRCFNEQACLDGDKENVIKNCAPGYEGIMCASCSEGYWKPPGTFLCYECTSQFFSNVKFYASPVIFFIFVMLLSKQFLRRFSLPNQELIATVRIFINMY